MPKESLQTSLNELHAALKDAQFKQPGERERMQALMVRIESLAAEPKRFEEDDTLLGSLEESIGNLELEHPVATSVLQRILQIARTLGGGGI